MPRINVSVEEDLFENFGEEINEYLTFDLVAPQVIEGTINNYDGNLYIVMSNGDTISMEYKHPMYGSKGDYYKLSINNGNGFNLPEVDDHPGLYIKEAYKEYLKYVLVHKSKPRSIKAISVPYEQNSLGLGLVF